MKTLIIVLLILTITLTAGYSYVKLFVQPPFGPVAILIVSVLGCLSLFFAITLFLYTRGKKKAIAKMWLFVVATMMTYAIAELILSLLFIKPLQPLMVSDPYRHHRFIPAKKTHFISNEFNYIQTINSIGLRGREIQLKRADDRYRILMLGDSFTVGKGVKDEGTFSVMLEKALSTEEYPVEVCNAGVDSYAPILSFFQLTKDLQALEPDLVILNLDMSDLHQEAAYRKHARFDTNGKILGVDGQSYFKKQFSSKVRFWIDQNLFITRMIFYYLETRSRLPEITIDNYVIRANSEVLKHTLAGDKVDRTKHWQNLIESILKIKEYCDTNKIPFLLTLYPWGHQVNEKEWHAGRVAFIPKGSKISDASVHRIQEFSQNNNIALLNLFPAFRAYNGASALYFNEDFHWTETGHKLMAEELERHIHTNYLKKHSDLKEGK